MIQCWNCGGGDGVFHGVVHVDIEVCLKRLRAERDAALLQISEERERCAKIVEGKIPIGGPRGMASLVLLTHIAKEIRAGVPLKPKHESEER
jgi:hypothetical protein